MLRVLNNELDWRVRRLSIAIQEYDSKIIRLLGVMKKRKEILSVHLRKRRRMNHDFDLERLARESEGYVGAEIEQAVVAAMYEAFAQDREFTQLDIIAALKSTLPLSRTMQEQVTALRDWARQRARPAASSVAEYQRMEF
jgi:SpoVK/Ycf46/Vps4 family AAA+-type ATPase